MNEQKIQAATLYLVATPIGNLEDMTFRAINTLKNVNLIAAEDTRHTGKLLQHFEINTPQISYHQHNLAERETELLNRLQAGEAIALVTDAGMPGISDPGYDLVKACIQAGITVIPIPGANAAITALCAAGLPTDRFVFEGFLPTKNKARQARLEALKEETRTMIFYEAPHRLLETLEDLATVFGKDQQIVLARELTKLHEEFWRGSLGKAISNYTHNSKPKGEYTLIVAGSDQPKAPVLSDEQIKLELQKLFEQGINKSQASRQLAQNTTHSRSYIYEIALSL